MSGRTIAFMEYRSRYSDRQLVFLDSVTKEVSRIPLNTGPLKDHYGLRLMGTDRFDGRKFWLIYAWSHLKDSWIFRLWEDGKLESIKETESFPLYIRPHLITHSEKEIVISEEKEGQFETIRKIPNSKGYLFLGRGYWPWFWSEDFGDVRIKEIYGRRYRSKEHRDEGLMWARLDLETFEIEELGDIKGWFYCFGPDKCYLAERDLDAGTLKIHDYQEGRFTLLKSFRLDFKKSYHPYNIFEGGIIIWKGKKVKVYAFPDLKEVKFKKL